MSEVFDSDLNLGCFCNLDEELSFHSADFSATGRKFTFALPYGSYPAYKWANMTNAQTVAVIRSAFADLSKLSGAKFVETSNTSKANIRIYFNSSIENGGQYEGNGKIKFSTKRKPPAPIAKAWVQHEVMHYLGYRYAPPADKFYHSRIKTEVFHGDGGGTVLGAHFTNWLQSRFGR
jgi:hypothetical protein